MAIETHTVMATVTNSWGATDTISIHFSYTEDNPFAVTMHVGHYSAHVEWMFSRELLAKGLQAVSERPKGLGDVQIWAQGSSLVRATAQTCVVRLIHRGPGDMDHDVIGDDSPTPWFADIELPMSFVQDFLKKTHDLVPRDRENMDSQVDEFIAEVIRTSAE